MAERQTAGRGRMGRDWASPPGNFYGSTLVVLRPGDPPAPTLALAMAVALFDCIAADGLMLKWPNDLVERNTLAKLAGILLERVGDTVVAGFGVNLLHSPDVGRPTTSLAALGLAPGTGFAERLADHVARRMADWRAGLAAIRSAWLERAHPAGTLLSATLPDGSRIDGRFDGLAEDCALRLRLADGTVRAIHAADVFLV